MRHVIALLLVGLLSVAQLSAPAYANTRLVPGLHLVTGGGYTAPVGFQIFCLTNARQCRGGGAAEVALSDTTLGLLNSVNRAVNRSIRPTAERVDTWSLGVSQGDCEDYVLAKRAQLMASGLPGAALRIAIAKTGGGVGHAVLVVRTEQGDLVLDSLTSAIKPWNETHLRWVAMSGADPQNWRVIV